MTSVSNERLFEIIRSPLISEKSTFVSQFNYYVFKVSVDSTKVENEYQQTSPLSFSKSEEMKPQKQSLISTEESLPPKEIIYLYGDGSFERFKPKK